ncbi:Miniconductance mechanosensitive channel YbdG [Halioglobus japonicus]|nr:Miniconductance mechanosensitive channel YbdG [Halioglobus japonicus]
MSNLNTFRNEAKQSLLSWLDKYLPAAPEMAFDIIVLLWIATFALMLHIFLHRFVHPLLARIAQKSSPQWQRALLANSFFRRCSYVLQGVIVQSQASLWLADDSPSLLRLIDVISDQWILVFSLLAFFSMLDSVQSVALRRVGHQQFPWRGLLQTIKLIASVLVGLLAISSLMGQSPLYLLSGLGALSAVLLLVFKDPIMGLVAGIQLSANKMLAVGDWLEMPKYGADGDVIDIALTTVKVRNWDKTITTIPTYALISDSFKNWQGMTESGGRQIKRSVLLETSSIKFMDDDLFAHLKDAELLGSYLENKKQEIEQANQSHKANMTVGLNGRRLTNVGTLRGYLVSYLKAHPNIHQQMTLMVRQLEPTSNGLPIQIYAFTNTTDWTEYEGIQSDIFDHIFAVLPEFGLRAHEAPTGFDIRSLVNPVL